MAERVRAARGEWLANVVMLLVLPLAGMVLAVILALVIIGY
ncbi:hypothetical protein [Saccharopolyspora gregorii]|uniref:Uncharacterized protein n=1 Tax=Saccharopolyspora gregorii TaxID=33914 RepID=A0ABP6RY78_9PSEU